MASFSPSDIQTLIGLFDDSDWDELHLEMGELELFIAKDPAATPPGVASPAETTSRAASLPERESAAAPASLPGRSPTAGVKG